LNIVKSLFSFLAALLYPFKESDKKCQSSGSRFNNTKDPKYVERI
jgi:hypothetical protein